MSIQDTIYAEKIAALSPATAGFGRDGGRAVLPFYVGSFGVYTAITDILGSVKRGTDGRLIRGEPASHPRYRWMLANKISNIQGVGKPTMVQAAFAGSNSIVHKYYAEYDYYLFTTEFLQQPYVSRNDSEIQVKKAIFFDGNATAPQSTSYAEEYRRFTSYDYSPGVEVVTANYGFQKFRGTLGKSPNGFTYPGAPRTVVGKSQLKVTWHYVPLSLIEDDKSAIIKYLGRINQTDWVTPWRTYPAASLLYVGVEAHRYMPYLPTGKISVLGTLDLDHEYVCDITFVFDYTVRKAEPVSAAILNGNWLVDGWNAKPWVNDKKFYYVTSTDGAPVDVDFSKWTPSYLSFLVQHLFTDPVIL